MRKRSWGLGVLSIAAMLLVTACSVQSPDDRAIVTDIQAKLFQDSVLKTRDIRVTSNQGVVALTGDVHTELERSAAERMAGQASGVKQVQNQLTVAPSTSAESEAPQMQQAPPKQVATTALARPGSLARERAYTRERERAEAASDQARAGEETTAADTGRKPAAPMVAAAPPPPPPPPPVQITIPAGTVITVRMIDGVDSSRDRAGHEFTASVESPVVMDDRVVVPRGADARVRLVNARNAGHMTGQSEVQLQLSGVTVAGTNYDIESTTYTQLGSSRGKRTAETVGGGAILGGLICAIAGHGKGAAIGSVIGAGGGAAVEAGTKAAPLRLSSETKLDFTLKAPITVTLPPRRSKARESE